MNTVGDRIKKLRQEKGAPQKEVANVIGVQRANYSKIEHNKQNMTLVQLKSLCEYFNVSADYILDIKVERKKTISKYDYDYLLRTLDQIKETIK